MFAAFLDSLAYDVDLHVTVRDWHRINLILHTPGAVRTLPELRAILRSLLTGSEQESRVFDRRFDAFFDRSSAPPFDVLAALADFRRLADAQPIPDEPTLQPDNARTVKRPPASETATGTTRMLPSRQYPETPRSTVSPQPTGPELAGREPAADMPIEPDPAESAGTDPNVSAESVSAEPAPAESEVLEPELPRIELIAEHPLISSMDDEQLGQWMDDLPPVEFDRDGPCYFSMNLVVPELPAIVGDDELQAAADSLGFFRADAFSTRLDIPRSIDATLRLGGICSPRFEHRRQLLSVLMLCDKSARDLQWNTAPRELTDGLRRHGVTVESWSFAGVPNRFTDARGRVWELEDLEELRRQAIVLLITDGHGMYERIDRRPLERMSRWPRVALLDPRPRELWDRLDGLARQFRLPLFACDGQGLIDSLRHFTSELGPTTRQAPTGPRLAIRGHYADDEAYLRHLLPSPLLEFAQACSVPTSISLGLAERLRRELFASRGQTTLLATTAVGRLLAIPGTQRFTCRGETAGFAFSADVRAALLAGFQQQPAEWQRRVVDFLIDEIRRAGFHSKCGSPAVAQLMAEAECLLAYSLVRDNPDVSDRLLRIWRVPELSAAVDGRVESILPRIWSSNIQRVAQVRFHLPAATAKSTALDEVPEHLARIPAGECWMGDPSEQGDANERPRHQVFVSEFFLEKTPVTWALWRRVHEWAEQHGYQFGKEARGAADDHPVHSVNWSDAVTWCNARSEMEGLDCCYFEDAQYTQSCRQGPNDAVFADWDANGYRLPTEAEWEKAARGGLEGQHFPWPSPGDKPYEQLLTPSNANYGGRKASRVGTYPANGFGLFDMSGNVWEWCWDYWDGRTYTNGAEMPNVYRQRAVRGGGWADDARGLRCSCRIGLHPGSRSGRLGFRVARGRVVSRQQAVRSERGAAAEARDEPTKEAPSERSSRAARVFFELAPPAMGGEITLATKREPVEAFSHPWNEPADVPAGTLQATFSAPDFAQAHATLEARAFHARTWRVTLAPLIPENLARIPAGNFWMGDPSKQGDYSEYPRHEVFVSEFYLERTPVTWALWRRVRGWAEQRGYHFDKEATGAADDHPVHSVSWRDAVKWCNARSEMEGLDCCYFEDAQCTQSCRQGPNDAVFADWDADGYRLPTEAEWEKAARGGLEGQHFPWPSPGDKPYEQLLTPSSANYGGRTGTTPVGTYPANGFGLVDMSGNVWEWCWDYWDGERYTKTTRPEPDPCGAKAPDQLPQRAVRGGSWAGGAWSLRCASRSGDRPGDRDGDLGFRVARGRVVSSQRAVRSERGAAAEARDEPTKEALSARSPLAIFQNLWAWWRGT